MSEKKPPITETGTVIKWENGKASIQLDGPARGECASCSMSSGCCSGSTDDGVIVVRTEQLPPGRRVMVHMNIPSTVTAAAVFFVLPLIALVIGFVVGSKLGGHFATADKVEAFGILGAVVLLVAAFAAIAVIEKIKTRKNPPIKIDLLDE